ncbi:MAG: hypothetical protein QM754_19485 [Tepidisphaeraceae bacterium]
MRDRDDFVQFLPTVDVPVDFVFGAEDAISPAAAIEPLVGKMQKATLTSSTTPATWPRSNNPRPSPTPLPAPVPGISKRDVVMNREKHHLDGQRCDSGRTRLECPRLARAARQRFKFVRTLVDVYRQVGTNYVENVDESKLQTVGHQRHAGDARSVHHVRAGRAERSFQ